MTHPSDIKVIGAEVFLLPLQTRMPIKFGAEVVTRVTCARVKITVVNRRGVKAVGWGETPLSAQWAWPGTLTYAERDRLMCDFCNVLARALLEEEHHGHPIELGTRFQMNVLPRLLEQFNRENPDKPMPHLAALVCLSAFDIAVHDAFGNSLNLPTYATYNRNFMNRDLSEYLEPRDGFSGRFPEEFLVSKPPRELVAWHLVGGLDPIDESDIAPDHVSDDHPILLSDWVWRDDLKALKIKLRGNDAACDYQRIVHIGRLAIEWDVNWLSTDFNCMVREPAYVNEILDRLRDEYPSIYGMLLYVEQPFPHDLPANPIDVHSVSSRKPLFMDESAHDWRLVRLGQTLGWTGVALKTCKTQTGAILSLCWAKMHGMSLMVQDLANPMLATIPHVLLAAHAGTIMGVETNASQFYPDASLPESVVHPGLYRRRRGKVDWESVADTGFGYRIDEISRELPEPFVVYGDVVTSSGSSV